MFCMGVCYKRGIGVAQDWEEAVRWYQKAAGTGYAAAQCNLGVCYERGEVLKKRYCTCGGALPAGCRAGRCGGTMQPRLSLRDWLRRGKDFAQAVKWYENPLPAVIQERSVILESAVNLETARQKTRRKRRGCIARLRNRATGWEPVIWATSMRPALVSSRVGRRRSGGTVRLRNRMIPVPSII